MNALEKNGPTILEQKFKEIRKRKEAQNKATVFSCLEDQHIRQYHAGKGMRTVLRGLQRRNLSQMRLGAVILHEVHRETNQN